MGKIFGLLLVCAVVSMATIFVYSTYATARSYAETREQFLREVGEAKTGLDQRIAFERARAVVNSRKSIFDLNRSKASGGQPIDHACLWTAQGYRENAASNPTMAGIFQGMWGTPQQANSCYALYGSNIADYGVEFDKGQAD